MPKLQSIIKFFILVFIYTISFDKLIGINSVSIIVLAVIALSDIIPSIKEINKVKLLYIALPAALFFGYLISALVSHDSATGMREIQVKLSLIIMPLIFISRRIQDSIDRDFVFKHFVAILTITICYCFAFNTVVRYWQIPNPFIEQTFMQWKDFSFTFANPSKTQSIYLGYYCSFALLIVVFQLFKSDKSKLFYIITGIILFAGLLFNGAKMALIGFAIIAIIECILLISRQKRIIGLSGIGLVTLVLLIFASQNHYLKARFTELSPSNWKIPMRGEAQNSVNLRFAMLNCGFSLLEENWLLGIPAGDLQQELNNCYTTKNYHEELTKFNFDNHNQFLNTWLSLGLIGFIVLLAMIFGTSFQALKNKDVILFAFTILIFLSFIPENMLCTQKGVVFISFFYCLLVITSHFKTTDHSNN